MKKLLVAALAVCFSCASYAENEFGFLVGGGFTFGGDKVASFDVEYYDDDEGTESLKAGEFMHVYGGFFYRHGAADGVNYGVQADVGYFYEGLFAENGDASFTRIPLELIGFMEYNWLRVGAGVTQHTNVELDIDLDQGGSGSVDFKDATGAVFIVEYLITKKFSVGLRYVNIEYELDYDWFSSEEALDGSHVGIMVNGLF